MNIVHIFYLLKKKKRHVQFIESKMKKNYHEIVVLVKMSCFNYSLVLLTIKKRNWQSV